MVKQLNGPHRSDFFLGGLIGVSSVFEVLKHLHKIGLLRLLTHIIAYISEDLA